LPTPVRGPLASRATLAPPAVRRCRNTAGRHRRRVPISTSTQRPPPSPGPKPAARRRRRRRTFGRPAVRARGPAPRRSAVQSHRAAPAGQPAGLDRAAPSRLRAEARRPLAACTAVPVGRPAVAHTCCPPHRSARNAVGVLRTSRPTSTARPRAGGGPKPIACSRCAPPNPAGDLQLPLAAVPRAEARGMRRAAPAGQSSDLGSASSCRRGPKSIAGRGGRLRTRGATCPACPSAPPRRNAGGTPGGPAGQPSDPDHAASGQRAGRSPSPSRGVHRRALRATCRPRARRPRPHRSASAAVSRWAGRPASLPRLPGVLARPRAEARDRARSAQPNRRATLRGALPSPSTCWCRLERGTLPRYAGLRTSVWRASPRPGRSPVAVRVAMPEPCGGRRGAPRWSPVTLAGGRGLRVVHDTVPLASAPTSSPAPGPKPVRRRGGRYRTLG
jgi:hypothetical protein